ncbi:PQQ-binding-like beta-propeller repeat protein [bacterium AH-315-D21]|nr:PQQ-binding-like beta-propeller repeat protein [bacterium AH-315-D21]
MNGSKPEKYVRPNRKRLWVFFALVLVMFATVACVNDLTPSGGWSAPIVEDGKLYIGNLEGTLVKFDPETGSLDNWRYPREEDGLGAIYGSPVIVGDNIYGVAYTCRGDNCEGEIYGLSLADGFSIWGPRGLEVSTKLVGQINVVGTTLLVGTSALGEEENGTEGYLYALDTAPGSPRLKWRVPLDGNAWSGVTVEGTTAYVATMAGTLYAIDARDGDQFDSDPASRILWTFEAESAIAGPIHVEGNSIYFGDLGSNVYKLNMSSRSASSETSEINTGNGEWKIDVGAWVWAKPVVENGVVFVSALDGSIHALDETTGAEKWSSQIDGQIVAAPTLFDRKRGETRERALAVPSGEKNVWVISVIDGRELGVFVTDEPVNSTPLIYGENLYVLAMNGDLKWFTVDDTTKRGCIELKEGDRCD